MIKIIQSATIERNLGGICYAPYWLYTALRMKNQKVQIFENVTVRDLDNIFNNVNDTYLVDLSSYPQIDLAQLILRDYKFENEIGFFGYTPLIKNLNLPLVNYSQFGIDILDGVFNFLFYNKEYKYGLLNDCDSHIKDTDNRLVVPIFLNIGCKRKCPYCYVGAFDYPFGDCTIIHAQIMIDYCIKNNFNIHFSDENFFNYKWINELLAYLQGKKLKYICLTDSISLQKAIDKYGEEYLLNSGNFLNEIGLETVDSEVLNKKQNFEVVKSKLNIFWLTMTFMPDETITSLNATGQFLEKYGKKKEDVLRRVVTNSTVGGLGQFYQYYHGTKFFNSLEMKGIIYTDRPIRLYPSFVGFKFLEAIPVLKRDITIDDFKWFDLYNNDSETIYSIKNKINGQSRIFDLTNRGKNLDKIIAIAQMARLNIIGEIK